MLEDPPFDLLCPGRRPHGIGAVLVPVDGQGQPHWDGFAHLLGQAVDAQLAPAIGLAPGDALPAAAFTHAEAVATAGAALGGRRWFAAVALAAAPEGGIDPHALADDVAEVVRRGGTPVLVPSPTLATVGAEEALALVSWMGEWCDALLVADLDAARWPGGGRWDAASFEALVGIDACAGVIDGSWSRAQEWDRIRRRDDRRPDFRIYSANGLAVDQLAYGADHALDLAIAVPDAIADRDIAWEQEDPGAVERNDALQALATIVLRPPVAAARHALVRTLVLRGWLAHDAVPGGLARRPESDDELILAALDRLGLI